MSMFNTEDTLEYYQNRVVELEAVAQSAIVLLSPPNNYQSYITCDERELKEWDNLRQALSDAGYAWDEYT